MWRLVSRMNVRKNAFATLPAMSVATIEIMWKPSLLPSTRNGVVILKCPVASTVSATAVPPSKPIVAPATPDRLSTICPVSVMFFRRHGRRGARQHDRRLCVRFPWANRASTWFATSAPSRWPA